MIDVERNIWVWAIGGQHRWPHAILASAEGIYKLVEENPHMIFFFGPRLMGDMNWFTPCAYDERVVRLMNNLEV